MNTKQSPYYTPYDALIDAGVLVLRECPKSGAKKAIKQAADLSAPLRRYYETLTAQDKKLLAKIVEAER